MKITIPPHRRAFAALVPATLLLAAPGLAQQVASQPAPTEVTPPPVVRTLPQAASAPAAQAAGIGDPNSSTPIAPEALAQAEAQAQESRAAARRAPARPARTAPVQRAVTRAAPAPARVEAPAPVAAAPVTTSPPAATVAVAEAPASTAPVATATKAGTTTDNRSAPIWPWIVGALVVIAGLAALLLRRRRRDEDVYDEDIVPVTEESAYAAPVYVAPVAAEPAPQYLHAAPRATPLVADDLTAVATEDATIVEPDAADVDALTAGDAPVADRPWLEFAMRPVRAGSNVDEALVEIELTVGNSGNIAAQDVRISTFMFTDGSASDAEVERLLLERGDDGVAPVTIEPGEGTRIDATLAMLKRDLGADSFSPVVMADARYRLPDGSEGRTSATFAIGRSEDNGAISPIAITRPLMHDDVEARLHGIPEHA